MSKEYMTAMSMIKCNGATAPVPCVPAIIMAWKSCDMHYFVGGAPALTKESFLTCTFGGTIKFQ